MLNQSNSPKPSLSNTFWGLFKSTPFNYDREKIKMEARHKKEQSDFKGNINFNPKYDDLIKKQQKELNELSFKRTSENQKKTNSLLLSQGKDMGRIGGYKRRTKRNKKGKRKTKRR